MAIDTNKNIRIQTTLNKEVHKELLDLAKKNNISASKLINQLIAKYINENK